MDHLFCLNTNSFPAQSAEEAYRLFNDAIQGMLQLNFGNDRFTMYLDSNTNLQNFLLANEYTYSNFSDQLVDQNENDLYLFLLELEDKSPALEFIDEHIIEEMSNYSFYIPDHVIPENAEVFSIAYFLSATLLSISSSDQWRDERLEIARTSEDGRYIDEKLSLDNIACLEHGALHFDELHNNNINTICDHCLLSGDFVNWYGSLTPDNQHRVINKYKLAVEREFNGGEPLFKTLVNGNGMREIRFSAYPGGVIRILFKAFSLEGIEKQAILLGFIKKNNNEGYVENIPKATEIFERLIC